MFRDIRHALRGSVRRSRGFHEATIGPAVALSGGLWNDSPDTFRQTWGITLQPDCLSETGFIQANHRFFCWRSRSA